MRKYKRITLREREKISVKRIAGKSIRTIAEELNRSPSSISREISRNKQVNNPYWAVAAQARVNRRLKVP